MHAGASVGIWPWSSKDSVIRFNEVWGYKGTFDGQGLDSETTALTHILNIILVGITKVASF